MPRESAATFQFLKRCQVLQGDDHRFDFAAVGAVEGHVGERRDVGSVGNRDHDLLGAQRAGAAEGLRQGQLAESDLAPVGEAAGGLRRPIGRRC